MMTRSVRMVVPVLALALALAAGAWAQENTLTAQEQAEGYILLFDGQTTAGWDWAGDNWVVENGVLVGQGKGGMLVRQDQWDSFILSIDFNVTPGANSGVFFRWKDLNDILTGIEIQILDSAAADPPSKYDCGAVYDIIAPWQNSMRPAGEWNTFRIVAVDNLVSVYLNGEPVSGMDLSRWTEAHRNPDGSENKFPVAYDTLVGPGHIGLQDHGMRIEFRNIKIKPLQTGTGPAAGGAM